MSLDFNCLMCGSCCHRTLIYEDGLNLGVNLLPNEKKLFKSYPDAIIPYFGYHKKGHQKIKILSYQMIIKPCPMLDIKTNHCKIYDNRPLVCRAYPFSTVSNGVSFEINCSFYKKYIKNLTDTKFESNNIKIGGVQYAAVNEITGWFTEMEKQLPSRKNIIFLFFDAKLKKWMRMKEIDKDDK